MPLFTVEDFEYDVPQYILDEYRIFCPSEWQKSAMNYIDHKLSEPAANDTKLNVEHYVSEYNTIFWNMPRRSGKTTLVVELAKKYTSATIVVRSYYQRELYPESLWKRIKFEQDIKNKRVEVKGLVLVDEPGTFPLGWLLTSSNTFIFAFGTLV
jgi:hypothetical protein